MGSRDDSYISFFLIQVFIELFTGLVHGKPNIILHTGTGSINVYMYNQKSILATDLAHQRVNKQVRQVNK